MTAGILALDLATRVGFAIRRRSGLIVSGSYKLPSGADVGWYLDEYDCWLRRIFAVEHIDSVWYEAPWVDGETHQETALKLLNLAGNTALAARRHGIPPHRVHDTNNASVRKHFIGKGRGKRAELKRMTIAACVARGFNPKNDDEADALALLDFAAHEMRLPNLVAGPLFGSASA